jgi:hypothetical protein
VITAVLRPRTACIKALPSYVISRPIRPLDGE